MSNTTLTNNFAKALNYYIVTSGKTKKEIADAIGVPPTTFSSWSKGKHLPDMDRLQTLANYLGAPITQFFNFTATVDTPDPLEKELTEIYKQLPNEDRLLLRSMALRLLNSTNK